LIVVVAVVVVCSARNN